LTDVLPSEGWGPEPTQHKPNPFLNGGSALTQNGGSALTPAPNNIVGRIRTPNEINEMKKTHR
jgi:hypothetical protein